MNIPDAATLALVSAQSAWDTDRLRELILDLYSEGYDYKTIGRKIGMPYWRVSEIRTSWLDRHGITKPRKGNICTVVVPDKMWGERLETGEFFCTTWEGDVTIYDAVDAVFYTGPCVEILFRDDDRYFWQDPHLSEIQAKLIERQT